MPYMYPPPGFGYDAQAAAENERRMEEQRRMDEMKAYARREAEMYLVRYDYAAEREVQRQRMESYGAIGQEVRRQQRGVPPAQQHVQIPSQHQPYQYDGYAPEPLAPLRPTYDQPVYDAPTYPYANDYAYPGYPDHGTTPPGYNAQAFAPTPYAAPAPAADVALTEKAMNEALATWYAEQVITMLVKPGYYRRGAGGADPDVWSDEGRVRDGWERVGVHLPQGVAPWADTPMLAHSHRPHNEAYDPWDLVWKNNGVISSRLVLFVYEMIQRMSCTPSHVVAAVWYLFGLGFHEHDPKGARLRGLLRAAADSGDPEAAEQRVAMLGLILAGKWLDDNSFQTKSWAEVTGIASREINALESAALGDLHFSLNLDLAQWVEHVHGRWSFLMTCLDSLSATDRVVLSLLDTLETHARSEQVREPLTRPPSIMNVGAECAAWAGVPDAMYDGYAEPAPLYVSPAPRTQALAHADVEMERYAHQVSALVEDDEDDEDDEFLEYDGAKRWLPSMSELRRSASNSSTRSDVMSALEAWRAGVRDAERMPPAAFDDESPFAFAAPPRAPSPAALEPASREITPAIAALAELYASRPASGSYASPREFHRDDAYDYSYGHDGDFDHAHDQADYDHCDDVLGFVPTPGAAFARVAEQQTFTALPLPGAPPASATRAAFKETGVHFEPGISQVRPGTALAAQGPRLVHLDPMTLRPLDENVLADPSVPQARAQDAAAYSHQQQQQVYAYPYGCSYADVHGYRYVYPQRAALAGMY